MLVVLKDDLSYKYHLLICLYNLISDFMLKSLPYIFYALNLNSLVNCAISFVLHFTLHSYIIAGYFSHTLGFISYLAPSRLECGTVAYKHRSLRYFMSNKQHKPIQLSTELIISLMYFYKFNLAYYLLIYKCIHALSVSNLLLTGRMTFYVEVMVTKTHNKMISNLLSCYIGFNDDYHRF